MSAAPTAAHASGFMHGTADLFGVSPALLRDDSLLGGLLIAAAGAAGLSTIGAPLVRRLPNEDVAAWLALDGCHIALHAFPARELLLLDVLAPAALDVRKAVDVFIRRLGAREVRADQRARG